VTTVDLERVQSRRELPARLTQRGQVLAQNRVISRALGNTQVAAPWVLRLFNRWPVLRRIPARVIGIGVRPEHVKTLEIAS